MLLTEDRIPFMAQMHEVDMKDEPLPKGVIMRIRGKAHHAGVVTANENLYAVEYYEREAKRIASSLDEGEVLMYPRHPNIIKDADGSIHIEQMKPTESASLLRGIEVLPDGWVMLEADVGEMDEGKNIAALVRMGAKVPISSRARGTAERKKLTDKHPAAEANPDWVGKFVNFVNEDFHLITFDFVGAAGSDGSKTTGWREGKEEVMDFDVKKFTKEQWKEIGESDQIKKMMAGVVKEAVKEREVALKEEFEKEGMKRIKEQVEEAIKSPEMRKLLEKDDDTDPEVRECPHCKNPVLEGMQFCPSCGRLLAEAEPEKTPDAKDKAIEELKKGNEELSKKLEDVSKKLENRDDKEKKAEKKVKAESIIDGALQGKPAVIVEQVRAEISLHEEELMEESAKELVEASIKRVEDFVKVFGLKAEDIPPGKGTTEGGDDNDGSESKLTESAEQQQSTLSLI